MKSRFFSSLALAVVVMSAADKIACGQILVYNDGSNSVREYSFSGALMNPSLIGGLQGASGIAVSGSNLFIAEPGANRIGQYSTSGAVINADLITTPIPVDVALSGDRLFVTNFLAQTVGQFTTSGQTLGTFTISAVPFLQGIAVSGDDLLVALNAGTPISGVGEFTTAGSIVNPTLIATDRPYDIVVSGDKIFVSDFYTGTIEEYTTTGATVNATLITGLSGPANMAILGDKLFVVNYYTGVVGEYSTSGEPINPALITGLSYPGAIAIVPEPSTWALLAMGAAAVLAFRRRRRSS